MPEAFGKLSASRGWCQAQLSAALLAWGRPRSLPVTAIPTLCLSRHESGPASAAPACGSRVGGRGQLRSRATPPTFSKVERFSGFPWPDPGLTKTFSGV